MGIHVANVSFETSDARLSQAFEWAKSQALQYVYEGFEVGPFYEAALPGRQAFCMRDVSHQGLGAQILGLSTHTKNMLFRFAENISETRDWCSYWEINRDNLPASVDYDSDASFWYNLPANFDVLDCCYRQFLWTGDNDYISHPVFQNFYEKTVTEFVRTWDTDHDGIMEHLPHYGRRGIATYNEQIKHPLVGGDMVAAQYAGYLAFARIQHALGNQTFVEKYESAARRLSEHYNTAWWNATDKTFYSFKRQDGSFESDYAFESNFLPLYFGIIPPGARLEGALHSLITHPAPNIEAETYVLDIYYRYGLVDKGHDLILSLADAKKMRKEYPEVSFTIIGAIAAGICGLEPNANTRSIATLSQVQTDTDYCRLNSISIFDCSVSVTHDGLHQTTLDNSVGKAVLWQACFHGDFDELLVDHERVPTIKKTTPNGEIQSYATVQVGPNESRTARIPDV